MFGEFKTKYAESVAKILYDREEVSRLLHMLIEEIIVYSRPVNETDVIAGQKKSGQLIPYKVDIRFRLPQEMLDDLVKAKGGTIMVRGEEVRSETRKGVEPFYTVLQTAV